MPSDVTIVVRQLVHRFFSEGQASTVIAELEAANLPLVSNNGERVFLAVLLICRGDIDVFRQQLSIAKSDWRDTLITAGLADENWPTVLLSAGIHGFKRRGQCDAA